MELDKLIAIIQDYVDIDAEDVTKDSKLRADLGLNSFDFVNIAVEVEREYNVKIPDVDISQLRTVGDLLDLVADMQKA